MNIIKYLLLLTVPLFFTCCSHSPNSVKSAGAEEIPPAGGRTIQGGSSAAKTVVQQNRSEITGEVMELKDIENNSFGVVIRILEVTEDPSFPSIALKDKIYEIHPGFVLDEKNEIADNQRNRRLLKLKNKKKGDIINGIIFLNNDNKWIIKDLME